MKQTFDLNFGFNRCIFFELTGGFVTHLRIGSRICSGTRYVGEYLPLKQFAAEAAAAAESGEPSGFAAAAAEFIIILVAAVAAAAWTWW